MGSHGGGNAGPASVEAGEPHGTRLGDLITEAGLQGEIVARLASKVEWCQERLAAAEAEWQRHLADAESELARARAALDATNAQIDDLVGTEG